MRLLTIDWDWPRLFVLTAKVTSSRVELESAQRLNASHAAIDFDDPVSVAHWFWEQLSVDQKSFDALRIILPRDKSTVRKIEVPALPENELPSIVRMQMATQTVGNPEQMSLDFVPTKSDDSESSHQVLACSIPSKVTHFLQAFAAAAELPEPELLLSSLVMAEAMRNCAVEPTSELSLGIAASRERIETCCLEGETLLGGALRRRRNNEAVSGQELQAELKRMLLAAGAGSSENGGEIPLHRWETQPEIIAAPFRVQLVSWSSANRHVVFDQIAAEQLEWFNAADGVAAMGAALLSGPGAVPQVNFASPRKQVQPVNRRKLYSIAGGIAAVLLIGLAFWWRHSHIQELEDDLATVQQRLSDTDEFLQNNKKTIAQASEVEEYLNHSLALGPHFETIESAMPPRDRMVFTRYQSIPLNRNTLARITGTGLAKSRQEVQNFAARVASFGYLVRPRNIESIEPNGPYEVEFEVEMEIPVAKEKSTS